VNIESLDLPYTNCITVFAGEPPSHASFNDDGDSTSMPGSDCAAAMTAVSVKAARAYSETAVDSHGVTCPGGLLEIPDACKGKIFQDAGSASSSRFCLSLDVAVYRGAWRFVSRDLPSCLAYTFTPSLHPLFNLPRSIHNPS
jgi:hypothetical protein